MPKTCTRCKQELELSEFNWKIRNITYATHCKKCSREYIRNHYLSNKKYYLEKARRRDKIIKEKSTDYIWKYLSEHPCIDCGENDPVVLEFDHRPDQAKLKEISRIIKDKGTLESVISEISKCDIRCANCHRRKTAKKIGTWKTKYIAPVA